jgi:hypothetical protein
VIPIHLFPALLRFHLRPYYSTDACINLYSELSLASIQKHERVQKVSPEPVSIRKYTEEILDDSFLYDIFAPIKVRLPYLVIK